MTMRVAIIDDDESICRSMLRFLREFGFHPAAFRSAEEFLRSPGRAAFECLVVDIQLRPSGMSGFELRQHMSDSGDRTPVIFLTALDDAAVHLQAQRLGNAIVFQKGADPLGLIDVLHRVAGGE